MISYRTRITAILLVIFYCLVVVFSFSHLILSQGYLGIFDQLFELRVDYVQICGFFFNFARNFVAQVKHLVIGLILFPLSFTFEAPNVAKDWRRLELLQIFATLNSYRRLC